MPRAQLLRCRSDWPGDLRMAPRALKASSGRKANTREPGAILVKSLMPDAGSYIVLESNRTLDRDELLLIAPSP